MKKIFPALYYPIKKMSPPENGMKQIHKRSFTLIELLVVIAIIAILATILFPTIASMRSRGAATSCKNMMRQYAFATLNYANNWDGYLPDIQTYLQPEAGFVRMFGADTFAEEITRCPGDKTTEALGRLGYCKQNDISVKVSIGGSGNTLSNSKSGRSTGVVVDMAKLGDSRMTQPSRSIIWTDYQATTQADITGAFYPAAKPGQSSDLGNIAFRHERSINAAYLDGHVGFVRVKDHIKLKNDGHDLDGGTWTKPSNNQYPFGPRPANVSKMKDDALDNPDVTYQ